MYRARSVLNLDASHVSSLTGAIVERGRGGTDRHAVASGEAEELCDGSGAAERLEHLAIVVALRRRRRVAERVVLAGRVRVEGPPRLVA
jgi:hypothetical protein